MWKFLLLTIIGMFASCKSSCEDGWAHLGPKSNCYRVLHDRATYYEADYFCRQLGGYLAEPRTAEETEMIDEFLQPELSYWIGLNDLASEGKFVWDSDKTEPGYTDWIEGHPNGNGHCVEKDGRYEHQWEDASCDEVSSGFNNHALCEKLPLEPTECSTSDDCGDNTPICCNGTCTRCTVGNEAGDGTSQGNCESPNHICHSTGACAVCLENLVIIPVIIPGEDDVGSAHSGCVDPGMPICDSSEEQCVACVCEDNFCSDHTLDTCRTGPDKIVDPAYVPLGICEWNRDLDESRGCSCDPVTNSGCPLGMACKEKEYFRKDLKKQHFNTCQEM